MKKYLLFFVSLIFANTAYTQPYENSWINYSQEYFKIKIASDGIYRLSQQDLNFAGFTTTGIDPRKIQVYHNGQEQYIYLEGENDGTFDVNDFIEFYAAKNDGSVDTKLYENASKQPTPRYSLFNDTAAYFLTYSQVTNGKRISLSNNVTFNLTPAPYFIKESFFQGKDYPDPNLFGYNRGMGDQSIEYEESEGWGTVFGSYFGGNYPINFSIPTDKVFSGPTAPNSEVSFCAGGLNNNQHNLSVSFPGINLTDSYYYQELKTYNYSIASNLITSASSSCSFNDVGTPPPYSMFYWFSIKYPHTYDLEGKNVFRLFVPDDSQIQGTQMDITNFNGGGSAPILYDLTNHKRVTVVQNGNVFHAIVANDGKPTNKECYISAASNIQSPVISKVNYFASSPGHFRDIGSLQIDSAFVIITSKKLGLAATNYFNYRNMHAPFINRCMLVDAEELYDQFAYGIGKHPLGIKNFAHYILGTWPTEAQHIFLIGKSVSPYEYRNNSANYEMCEVASYGVPTSDILLTAGVTAAGIYDTIWAPGIPVGRLSAENDSNVNDYLHKVGEYELAQTGNPQEWQKEILHFGGGNDTAQQNQLAGYLAQYEAILEDSFFGGHVTTYTKFNSDPIQNNLSDSLQNQIDNGVAIMTFFGHASGSTFDISTDEPGAYGNHGKYPLIVANSCFSGDFHTPTRSISENFVLEPEKAAIGFLASVGLGNPVFLLEYTRNFFENVSYTDYGSTIGHMMKKTIQKLQPTGNDGEKQVSFEMSLQGDPALRLNCFSKPDYLMDESQISFIPNTITTDLDTFTVRVKTRNLGKAVQDSFIVNVTHTYPNGVDSVYSYKRGRCYYSDNLDVKLNTGGFQSAGLNKIKVEVDLPDSVDEYQNYLNNSATTDLFIYSKDIIPIYPPDYAIHPYSTVTLRASTANPLAGIASYRFEIDTLDLNLKDITPGMVTSNFYRTATFTDSGGIFTWNPTNLTLLDSVVYFWRVANDSIQYDPVNYHWQQSSFIYIPGKTGWAQSHFHQFKSDNYQSVKYDTIPRVFEFVNNVKALKIKTRGFPDGTQAQYNQIGYWMNNSPIEYNGCQTAPAVMVAVLDSISLDPWNTCGNNFGQYNTYTITNGKPCNDPQAIATYNCRARPENYFIFQLYSAAQRDSFVSFINSVPNRDYILMYSWYTDQYSVNSPQLSTVLSSLGFNPTHLTDNQAFIYFAKKGSPGLNQELIGDTAQPITTEYIMDVQLSSIWNRGYINSVTIGPAARWESLHWNQRPKEATPGNDVVYLNILGLNSATNQWDPLANGIQYGTGKDTSLSWISASTYPTIKLQCYLEDYTLLTPPQMQYWRIYYDEVPECAINANRTFIFHSNPLSEGDTLQMSIAIDNIGNLPMDSLGVSFYLYDNNRTKHDLINYKLDSLRGNQSLIASIVIDTTFGLAGLNSLWIEANPYIAPYHQPEKHHFNNFAEVKFNVNRDNINPILDVTFDGVHILNKDIVSGKPQIVIQLHDENKFLALNDKEDFVVMLTQPNSNTKEIIKWDEAQYGNEMRFIPAVLPKNSCRIEWNPALAKDGVYWLEVEARDRSKNQSGKYNYKISFEVINKPSITEVLNYPNPFSTSTRFVFTLTGNEVPTGMKIQIMTITGKIIREIMQNELGNIHVGRNITDYAWDGKDEFGDQLANGLYLYHVVTDLHGQSIEKRETEIDKYFKKGWGKMYLLR